MAKIKINAKIYCNHETHALGYSFKAGK